MNSPWLPAILFLALLYGCSCSEERRPVRKSPTSAKSLDTASKRAAYGEGTLAEALAQAEKMGNVGDKDQKTDSFGLPLKIELVAPEVPAEIRDPSPPVKQEPSRP